MQPRGLLFLSMSTLFGYMVVADSKRDDPTRRYSGSCPAQNPVTHECFDLHSDNSSCLVFHLTCQPADPDEGGGTCIGLRYTMVSVPCQIFQCKSQGCCPGWIRNEYGLCEASSSEETALYCENGGWESKHNSDLCECLPHFTGDRCEKPVCRSACLNGGMCEVIRGVPVCICPSSFFSGARCEKAECTGKCLNGGVCIKDGVQGRCKCLDGFLGERCQYETNDACPRIGDTAICTDVTKQPCKNESSCEGDAICCFDGCKPVCMAPVPNKCDKDGSAYFPGDSYEPVACTKCVCQESGLFHCINITCAEKTCADGHSPIHVEGHCCKRCLEDEMKVEKGPEFTNCPTRPTFVNVQPDGYVADMPTLDLIAVDYEGRNLSVNLSRNHFAHSRGTEVEGNVHYVTAYSECDKYGRRAECVFQVLVVDRYPPKFTSCPIEIDALDDDVIEWDDPIAWDNVGIYKMTANGDEVRGKILPVGAYVVSYTVRDFDRNQAICSFMIRIFDKDGFHYRFPQAKSGFPISAIVGCSIAIVVAVVFLVFVFQRLKKQDIASTSRHSEQAINNIFMMSGGVADNHANDVKLPAYTPPAHPPPYTDPNEPPVYDPVYEEIPARFHEPHYENTNTGYENPAYVNDIVKDDAKNMEYLKT